jgi:alpha-galactosidase/6-phospho-beta-glucosidase family protein
MKSLRIVIIGGGSFNWTPELVRDLVVQPELQESTIVLEDTDPQALDLTYSFSQKLISSQKSSCKIEKTTSLQSALLGADVVIVTITTGGLEAMRADIEIPEKYGIYQSVGDTVGPGGLSRALRNIPVMVEIAKTMESVCPDAWLLNYTNPMSTLCRAVARETKIKVAGLCHEYLDGLKFLERLFNIPAEDLEIKLAGINHLLWLLDLEVNGVSGLPQLKLLTKKVLEEGAISVINGLPAQLVDHGLVKASLFQVYNALPMAGDRHAAEFFPFFLSSGAEYGKRFGLVLTHIDDRFQWRTDSEKLIHKLMDDDVEMQTYLKSDSGESAPQICVVLASEKPYKGILNLPNKGQISNLPDDVIVETLGVLDENGAFGLHAGPLLNPILNIVQNHVLNQELIVEAALSGDRKLALQALVNDPLVFDIGSSEVMLDEMLLANRSYLPKFFRNL